MKHSPSWVNSGWVSGGELSLKTEKEIEVIMSKWIRASRFLMQEFSYLEESVYFGFFVVVCFV